VRVKLPGSNKTLGELKGLYCSIAESAISRFQ